jgi:D-alanyl-D-alanine-carboxypeptidase/D-alanyl-D-alanine-endopeptidase
MQSAQALGEDLYVRSGSTGLALVVVRGNQTTIETFGETSPGSHQTPTPDSLLRLCSLTKIFTADLLVKLMQAKVVRLDTPLQTLAPAGRHVPLRDGRPITLLDLATHTAGLPRELGTAPRDTPHFTYPGPERRWAWLPAQRLRTTPGTAALYSNIGFDFLADALERAAHTPYPKLLAARTTKPLDMSETTFTPTPAQCARLLGTAHPEGPCTPTTNTDGSSGLYSTATDMARFLQYLLGTGGSADPTHPIPRQSAAAQAVYIDPASLASISGLDHAGDPTGIGLGWIHTAGSSLTGQSAVDIIEKTGGGAGFLTYIAMLPAQHIGIFVAATDGAVETHLNLFRNANNVLLSLAGLPTIYIPPRPEPPPRTRARARSPRQN